MRRVYISGPITGTEDYMERFEEVERELAAEGRAVINPARVNGSLPAPTTTYEEYMKVSLLLLSFADEIYMMRGWERSRGACLEREYAKAVGIPVREQGD